MEGFEGAVAVVTGGAGGIGAAVVAELTQRGCAVASLDRAPAAAAMTLTCDVTSPASVEDAVRRVESELGRVQLLVCAAGILTEHAVDEMPVQAWRDVLDVSLTGTFLVCRSLVPKMAEARAGKVVAFSSGFGTKGYQGGAHYAAAKAGVNGFVKSLALEVAARGVTVNAVAPGPVDTAMLDPVLDDESRQRRVNMIPMGRMGRPEDVVGPVLFLLSRSSDYVTGQVLHVNGGMLMP